MKSIFDGLQFFLSQDGNWKWVFCFILALSLMQLWKMLKIPADIIGLIRRYILKVSKGNLARASALTVLLFVCSGWMVNKIQFIEQRWLSPVYIGSYSFVDDDRQMIAYEMEIQKHITPKQLDTLRAYTIATAQALGCHPIRIYECALLENGLKPFRVRDDEIAAGWIQFTRRGLKSSGVTLEQVIAACRDKRITPIMALTDFYLKKRRIEAGRPLVSMLDVYMAIFSPAKVNSDLDATLYEGRGTPAYDKNKGLDGWRLEGEKIVRGERDGKITKREVFYCLEYKRLVFLKSKL